MIEYLLFTAIEFVDCQGVTRTLRGCSLAGRQEFFERLRQIRQHLEQVDASTSWQELFDQDDRLRFLVGRALELNGISLEWVSLAMVEDLLFVREGLKPGWLIQLNTPRRAAKTGETGATFEELLAGLWGATGELEKALALASNPDLPAEQLVGILEARAEQLKEADPQYRKRKTQRRQGQEQIEKIKAAMAAEGLPTEAVSLG